MLGLMRGEECGLCPRGSSSGRAQKHCTMTGNRGVDVGVWPGHPRWSAAIMTRRCACADADDIDMQLEEGRLMRRHGSNDARPVSRQRQDFGRSFAFILFFICGFSFVRFRHAVFAYAPNSNHLARSSKIVARYPPLGGFTLPLSTDSGLCPAYCCTCPVLFDIVQHKGALWPSKHRHDATQDSWQEQQKPQTTASPQEHVRGGAAEMAGAAAIGACE